MKIATVAIIGRPNVGKSTLYNCFAKAKKAIVSDIPGTTRDSLIEKIEGENFDYLLIDTAGLQNEKGNTLKEEIQAQVEITMQNADLIIFLIDGKDPITTEDEEIVKKLRKGKMPFLFIANKIDDGNTNNLFEFTKFGFGIPLPISAKNYTGMWDIEEAIEEKLKKLGFEEKEESIESEEESTEEDSPKKIKIAFIGRPNVGKSSLFNFILGDKRSVVSDIPGTTRDCINAEYEDEDGQVFEILDTAGLKKPGKIGRDIDFWSSVRTARAIEEAHVCVLVLDALDGVTHQDMALAGKIIEAGKGLVLGVNKVDLIKEKSKAIKETDTREIAEIKMWNEDMDEIKQRYLGYLKQKLPFLPWAPAIFFSAKTGKGIDMVLKTAKGVFEETKKRIPTSTLNLFLPEVFYGHLQPSQDLKRGKLKFVSQVNTNPPKFLFFVNNKEAFHFSYYRYLENKIREKYGFYGTPIKIELRDERDEKKEKKRKK